MCVCFGNLVLKPARGSFYPAAIARPTFILVCMHAVVYSSSNVAGSLDRDHRRVRENIHLDFSVVSQRKRDRDSRGIQHTQGTREREVPAPTFRCSWFLRRDTHTPPPNPRRFGHKIALMYSKNKRILLSNVTRCSPTTNDAPSVARHLRW